MGQELAVERKGLEFERFEVSQEQKQDEDLLTKTRTIQFDEVGRG